MDPILFLCLLNGKNDQLILTHDKLIVIFKGKSQVFYRSNILKLILTKKKLIVPLIIGGIGASLSIIAMSMGWYYRQLNLVIVFLFLGVLYYGFTGKDALELFEKGHSNIFLLKKTLPSIQKFLSIFSSKILYTIWLIPKNGKTNFLKNTLHLKILKMKDLYMHPMRLKCKPHTKNIIVKKTQ